MKSLLFVAVIVMASGCSGLEKNKADLESAYVGRDKKLNLLSAPKPEFDGPATYTSVYLIRCPKCTESQFLMPVSIQTVGCTTTTNGILETRSLYFECETRRCNERINISEQVMVPPVKAIRVR